MATLGQPNDAASARQRGHSAMVRYSYPDMPFVIRPTFVSLLMELTLAPPSLSPLLVTCPCPS